MSVLRYKKIPLVMVGSRCKREHETYIRFLFDSPCLTNVSFRNAEA